MISPSVSACTARSLGGVVIVKGSSSFASMTIPDPAAVNTIQIDGTVASGQLGISMVGIGQFFPSPAGHGLIIGAPIARAVYGFRGQAPASGMLTTAAADDSVIGTAADQYGDQPRVPRPDRAALRAR